RLGRNLLVGRLAVELAGELGGDPMDGPLSLSDMGRDPDRPAGVVQAALDRLTDPQRRVGGELVPAAPVELLGSPNQAQHGLLDQVLHREAKALIAASV